MQLTFPNGEHDDVAMHGEVTIGSRDGARVRLADAGLAPLHASIVADRRGVWLRVPAGVPGVHLNARPVRRLALLRAGDLLCLDRLRVVLRCDDEPAIERRIPGGPPPAMGDALRVAATRVVLRALGGDGSHVNGTAVRDAVLSPGDQLAIDQHRFVLEAPGLPLRGQSNADRPAMATHTQTIKAVRVPVAADPAPGDGPGPALPPARDPAALWWLIAAATVLAAALTALLVYAPR